MKKVLYAIVVIFVSLCLGFIFVNYESNPTYEGVIPEDDIMALNVSDMTINVPEGFEMSDISMDSQLTYFKGDDSFTMAVVEDLGEYEEYYDLQDKTINGINGQYWEDEFNGFMEYGFIFSDGDNIYCVTANKLEYINESLESK